MRQPRGRRKEGSRTNAPGNAGSFYHLRQVHHTGWLVREHYRHEARGWAGGTKQCCPARGGATFSRCRKEGQGGIPAPAARRARSRARLPHSGSERQRAWPRRWEQNVLRNKLYTVASETVITNQKRQEWGSRARQGTHRGPQPKPDARHLAIAPTDGTEGVGMSQMTLPPCSSRGLDARSEESKKRALIGTKSVLFKKHG